MIIQEWKGGCLGVRLSTIKDPPNYLIAIQFLVEDDGNWMELTNEFNAFWLRDLEAQIEKMKNFLETSELVEKYDWGYRLSEKGREVFYNVI